MALPTIMMVGARNNAVGALRFLHFSLPFA